MCNCFGLGAKLERASIPQHLMPMVANNDSRNMRVIASILHHSLGKIWRGFLCMCSLQSCVSRASMALSKHGVGAELVFCLVLCDHSCACTGGGGCAILEPASLDHLHKE